MNDEVEVYSITDDYMKSNYVKTLAYELIENLIYFLCVYPIVAMINYISNKDELMLYLNLITIIPIFLMTYLRVKIKKMRNFILGIFGVMAISSIIIGVILKQYIFLVILIFWAINSIQKCSDKQRVQFNKSKLITVQVLLIPQIIIIAGADFKKLQVCTAMIASVIMLISIGYICKIRNIRLTMDDAKDKRFNKKDINIFIAGITLLIAILIILLYKLGVFEVAYNLTKNLANSLINIVNSIMNMATNNQVTLIPKKNTNIVNPFNNYVGKTSSIFELIISIVLIVVPNVALISGIIFISYLVINIILICIKNSRNKDKITFAFSGNKENEIKKEVNRLNKIKYNISKSTFLNDKEKVRKLYKEKILKYKKNNIKVNNFFSTNEIQHEILSKASDNIEDLTRVYEKARYSNEEITKDDVEIFKRKNKSS